MMTTAPALAPTAGIALGGSVPRYRVKTSIELASAVEACFERSDDRVPRA